MSDAVLLARARSFGRDILGASLSVDDQEALLLDPLTPQPLFAELLELYLPETTGGARLRLPAEIIGDPRSRIEPLAAFAGKYFLYHLIRGGAKAFPQREAARVFFSTADISAADVLGWLSANDVAFGIEQTGELMLTLAERPDKANFIEAVEYLIDLFRKDSQGNDARVGGAIASMGVYANAAMFALTHDGHWRREDARRMAESGVFANPEILRTVVTQPLPRLHREIVKARLLDHETEETLFRRYSGGMQGEMFSHDRSRMSGLIGANEHSGTIAAAFLQDDFPEDLASAAFDMLYDYAVAHATGSGHDVARKLLRLLGEEAVLHFLSGPKVVFAKIAAEGITPDMEIALAVLPRHADATVRARVFDAIGHWDHLSPPALKALDRLLPVLAIDKHPHIPPLANLVSVARRSSVPEALQVLSGDLLSLATRDDVDPPLAEALISRGTDPRIAPLDADFFLFHLARKPDLTAELRAKIITKGEVSGKEAARCTPPEQRAEVFRLAFGKSAQGDKSLAHGIWETADMWRLVTTPATQQAMAEHSPGLSPEQAVRLLLEAPGGLHKNPRFDHYKSLIGGLLQKARTAEPA